MPTLEEAQALLDTTKITLDEADALMARLGALRAAADTLVSERTRMGRSTTRALDALAEATEDVSAQDVIVRAAQLAYGNAVAALDAVRAPAPPEDPA